MSKLLRQYRLPCLLSLSIFALGVGSSVWAADGKWEVKSGDTMGVIVSQHYAGYSNRTAIMEAIHKANPKAFINSDLNRLVIGQTLVLPDAATIEGLNAPPPVTSVEVAVKPEADAGIQVRLKELETQLTQLQGELNASVTENTALKEKVVGFEAEKQTKGAELGKLEARIKELEQLGQAPNAVVTSAPDTTVATTVDAGQLDSLKAELEKNQQALSEQQKMSDELQQQLVEARKQTAGLQTQLSELTSRNEVLQNDLAQARTAAETAEKNAARSNWLPWILLGLLALLVLPLLWLLKRKRDEPIIATVTAPLAPVPNPSTGAGGVVAEPAIPVPEPQNVTTSDTPTELSDTVAPSVEEHVVQEEIPENPDVDLKLDIARAYLDLRDSGAAAEILQEVVAEGGNRQRQEAREILSFIS